MVYNQTWCEASLLLNKSQTKAQENATKSCKTTLVKCPLRPNQSGEDRKKGKRVKGISNKSDGFKVSFEVNQITSFVACKNRSLLTLIINQYSPSSEIIQHDQPEGVFGFIIRNKSGSFNVHTCLMLETYRHIQKQGTEGKKFPFLFIKLMFS